MVDDAEGSEVQQQPHDRYGPQRPHCNICSSGSRLGSSLALASTRLAMDVEEQSENRRVLNGIRNMKQLMVRTEVNHQKPPTKV